MQIRAAEISDIIREQIKEYEKQLEVRETGVVLSCGDGIARLAPLKLIRIAAASLFAILGAMALLRLDFGLLGA